MVHVNYPGLSDPKAACLTLRPYRTHLIQLQMRCRPQSPQYKAFEHAIKGMDDTIEALTGERTLLHARADVAKKPQSP